MSDGFSTAVSTPNPPASVCIGAASPTLGAGPSPARTGQDPIIVIVDNSILRESLLKSMALQTRTVRGLPGIDGCEQLATQLGPDTIIVFFATRPDTSLREFETLRAACTGYRTLLVTDLDDPQTALTALLAGAQGVVPANASLALLNGVLSLILAGGIYVPPECLSAAQRPAASSSQEVDGQLFTLRQRSIISAIRKGSPNKIIAYELGMCESTVKVHIRNIMKKLNVRNRTELAFRASEMNIPLHRPN